MLHNAMRFLVLISLAAFLCLSGTLTVATALAAETAETPYSSSLRVNIPSATDLNNTSPAAGTTIGSSGQIIERISATVNDDVITSTDLGSRMALAFFSSNLPATPENQARIGPQVLRTLIDESLQRQEAKRNGITVDAKDLDQAVAGLAQQNNMPPEQIAGILAQRGVKLATLRQQVEASLLWSKVVQRELRPQVEVGDEEIASRLAEIQANAGKPEYLVAEIFLRVDDTVDETQVQSLMQGLAQQLQSGTPFSALAQQFSQGAGAMQGGDLGWIQGGQLSPELDRALLNLHKGEVSEPILDAAGYHLLLVRDQRLTAGADPTQVQVQLQQISIPSTAATSDADLMTAAANAKAVAAASVAGCTNLEADVKAKVSQASVSKLDAADLSALPPWLASTVQSLQVGEVSDPVAVDNGAAMVVLCGRTQPTEGLPTHEQILNQIGTERLELAARRLMRDLRREAIVDIRIGKKPGADSSSPATNSTDSQ